LTPWEQGFIANYISTNGQCPYYDLRRFCRKFQTNQQWADFKATLKGLVTDTNLFKQLVKQCQRIILEVSHRLKNSGIRLKVRRFITYGIGSAGYDPNKDYLRCSDDMKIVRAYAHKHNYYLGSSVEEGTIPCLDSVKERIKYACICAWECNASLVLYYTGHGYKSSGDWSFYDGSLSFTALQGVIAGAMHDFGVEAVPTSATTFVVCDSCHSGYWCAINDPRIKVIAACGATECTEGKFAQVFFKAKLRLTDSEILRFKVRKLRSEINKHTGGADDMNLKADLVERLQDLEEEKRKDIISEVMNDEPCCSGRRLLRKHVVHHIWFKSRRQEELENPIPEMACLAI